MTIFSNQAFSLTCRCAVFIVVTCMMIACGGGGGGSDTPASTPVVKPTSTGNSPEPVKDDYSPDKSRLGIKAENTMELYAEPEFNFSGVKTVMVDLSVHDMIGQAAANAMVKVFIVRGDATEIEQVRADDKSLLALLKTDDAGNIMQPISVAQTAGKLFLSVDLVGIDNNALITLDEDLLAQYQF